MNVGVVLAGGVGSRYGGDIPKQFEMLKDRQVISYAIEALKKCEEIDAVIVACDKKYQHTIRNEYEVEICNGGDTRNKTVANALSYARAHYNTDKIVLVDAARPLLKAQNVSEILAMLDDYKAVVTASKIVDSLGFENKMLNRSEYYLVQTPEAFQMKVLDAFDENKDCTAIVEQSAVKSIGKYFGMARNIKITYNGDLKIALAMMEDK